MIKRRRECSYAVLLFFIPFFLQKILQSLQEFQVSLRNLQRGVGCFLSRSLYKNRHSCSFFQWTAECITNIREKLRVVCSKLVFVIQQFFHGKWIDHSSIPFFPSGNRLYLYYTIFCRRFASRPTKKTLESCLIL